MFSTSREMLAYLRKEEIAAIDLKFCDLMGRWHHLTSSARKIDDSLFSHGEGFDASNMAGFKTVEAGDMVLVPDPTTAFLDPFFDLPTLSVICDVKEATTRAPFARDPRGLLERAEAYLKSTGIADECRFGPEYEFHLFDHVTYRNDVCGAQYEVFSSEGRFGNAESGVYSGATLAPKGGYHAIPPEDQYFNIRAEMVAVLEAMGVDVHYHHHEVGSLGQQEIEVDLAGPTRSGDIAMIVKYVVRMVARRHGLVATFMPKPFYGEAGSGMHFHQHLFKGGKPLFHEKAGYGHLSKLGLSYTAGLLAHAPGLLGITNPTTNSYRRLVPGYEAPVNAFFSLANRSAAIRIPGYATRPDQTRIEFRSPDATCNPYLAMAAMLMAGIDGVKRNLDPTAEGFGPYDKNVFEMSEAERHEKIKPLPAELDEALAALAADNAYLLEGNVFNSGLIADWIAIRGKARREVALRPHPYEVEMLLDC